MRKKIDGKQTNFLFDKNGTNGITINSFSRDGSRFTEPDTLFMYK